MDPEFLVFTLMTEPEERDLLAMGNDLAAALHDPFEPACVAKAFASDQPETRAEALRDAHGATRANQKPVLTMQSWIDLEAIRSPLLQSQLPPQAGALDAAARVLNLSTESLSAEEAVAAARAIRRAVEEAFSLALPMRRPGSAGAKERDGFGAWLPLFTFLVTEAGLALAEARACRVDQALALLACCRRNQGWECAGLPYAQRDVMKIRGDRAECDKSNPADEIESVDGRPREKGEHQ